MKTLSVFLICVAICQIVDKTKSQQCPAFGSEESILGWMLQGHIYQTMMANIGLHCLSVCLKDDRCQSFNFVMSLHMCEFSDRTKEARPEDFIPDADRYYFRKYINRVPLGSISDLAATSCKEIKMSEGRSPNGKYWMSSIKPGIPVLAFCDMKTEDVNECTASSPVCHVNATCNNTLGSYRCTSKPGYAGDGKTCKDFDECSASLSVCHVNALCSNIFGSYHCACKLGYAGDGKTCKAFKAVFTNLGATGRLGPSSLGGYYSGQDHDGQVTLVSGIQHWVVPYTCDYKIEAVGAAGGYDRYSNSRQYRGRGARMIGIFRLVKGETIKILVGQEGGINRARSSAGGGGGTFVVRGSNTPLIIAGGGGGGETVKSRHTGCDASTSTSGRAGYRSWSGGSGGHGATTADNSNSGGGGGGFYSSGRSSKQFGGSMGNGGEGGKGFLQGGVGGRARLNNAIGGFGGGGGAYGNGGGAGGGGGYSGGSSGDNEHDSCGGGGGSYNAGKNQQNECCYNTAGHGRVTITLT
ncbi:uncharacterized protein [Montipora capricornis]|uniref:uncharacterized protein n=1 Tax=Montipora capricornis TaxID=246305 RepID=UPI0035F182DA